MCNACGFLCCGSDQFGGCGCESCGEEECLRLCRHCDENECGGECQSGDDYDYDDLERDLPDLRASAPPREPSPAPGDDS